MIPRIPTATCRIQLREGVDFAALTARLDQIADLGVSHLYLSPIFAATEGSTHGYDITDPTRIEEMARRHLVLGPTTSDQMIVSVAGIPQRLQPVDPNNPHEPALVAGTTVPMPARKPGGLGGVPVPPASGSVVLASYKVAR